MPLDAIIEGSQVMPGNQPGKEVMIPEKNTLGVSQDSEAFQVVKLKTSALKALRLLSYELSRREARRVTFSETLVIIADAATDTDLDNMTKRYNEMHRRTAQ